MNFITGAGGFLQAVLFGYGGIRLKLDQLEIQPRGHLPNQASKFVFRGIKYQGAVLDLTITNKIYEIVITVQNSTDTIPLVYEHAGQNEVLQLHKHYSFPIDTRLIVRRSVPLCP